MKNIISIHIGEYYASRRPVIIHTMVGSCVAVCLFDPLNSIGGMNHILLPGRADMKRFDAPARYGINAMELLINRMMRLGANRKNFEAKVFGGAHLLPAIALENGVGRKIAAFTMEFLKNENIQVINKDLQGHASRRIYFHTDTGDVFLKRTLSRYYSNIVIEEKKMLRHLKQEVHKSGTITLFSGESPYANHKKRKRPNYLHSNQRPPVRL